jgi:aspartyl-tRNA synthetase
MGCPRVRDLGGVLFIDIRDRAGVSQIVVRDDETLLALAEAAAPGVRDQAVRAWSSARSPDTINPKLATGEVEVLAREFQACSRGETPPIPDRRGLRRFRRRPLRYRYLDLRRPRLHVQRGAAAPRRPRGAEVFRRAGLLGDETPILTKSTPKGARDYLVPSRVHPGEFYALPQSPQIFKQILMIAGTDRYFQIVRCFRDEDLRADRQPSSRRSTSRCRSRARDDLTAHRAADAASLQGDRPRGDAPFRRMPYAEAIAQVRLGQARSALRLEIATLRGFRDSEFRVFKQIVAEAASSAGSPCRAATVHAQPARRLVDQAKQMGFTG